MTKTIILTGVTGFLGSNLAIGFVKLGWHVVGIKRSLSSISRISNWLDYIELYNVEDFGINIIRNLNVDIDAVIHAATCYGRHGETMYEIFDSNTSFPLRILELALISKAKLFINIDTILDKYLNLYSFSKNQLLEWGKYVTMSSEISFINIKLEHIYGLYDDPSKFVSYVINQCASNAPDLLLTAGLQTRDFIYVSDVISAFIALICDSKALGPGFYQYELGSGKSLTIKSFVELVHCLSKSSTELKFGALPYRQGEIMNSCASPVYFRSLGWEPSYTIEMGISTILSIQYKIQ